MSMTIIWLTSEGKDILNKEQIAESCKGCDAVMHLAAILEEDAGLQELRKVNVEGTKNVLEAAAKQRVKKAKIELIMILQMSLTKFPINQRWLLTLSPMVS